MARGRFISESVATDARLNSLSVEAELVYLMTIPHLDRDGLIEGDPNVLWGRVCPKRRQFLDTMAVYIQEWAKAGLVLMYDTNNGPVLWFKGFIKNQLGLRYERETPSKFPPPPQNEVRQTSGKVPDTDGNCSPQWQLEVEVKVQDQGGDHACAREPEPQPAQAPPLPEPVYSTQPKPGEYMPGLSYPRQRQARCNADHIGRQRDKLGLTAVQLTTLTDTVLARMNATEIAALDTDIGNDELRLAQEAALALAGLGNRTPEGIGAVFDTWYTHDFRGEKGDPPTYRQLVDHAKAMRQKVAARKSAMPKLSDAEKSSILTRAKSAQSKIRTATQFKSYIDPQWQQDIDEARGLGLL